ncbi:MAG: TIM-barrel domain-containing protein [Acidobacteriaceae bacterium]
MGLFRREQLFSQMGLVMVAVIMAINLSGAGAQQLTLRRGDATVVVQPYAPNVVRVTLSLLKGRALAPPGYGIIAQPQGQGWSVQRGSNGDVLRSPRMVVTVSPQGKPYHVTGQAAEIPRYFIGSNPWVGVKVTTPDGKTLLDMQNWQMSVPNNKDGNRGVLNDRHPGDDPFYQVGAGFAAPSDEHDYGLGQNQLGFLDRRGHVVDCEQNYDAPGGETICVPFVVSNKGYGLLWDNPSKTTVAFAINGQTQWISQVGQRVSFFVIAGQSYDEIYAGYRLLTGSTPMLPKSAYGFIQSKQRYRSQAELLAVARGYRQRHLPIDDLVIDWFTYTRMGQMDMDPRLWPDPAEMNHELHAMNFHVMISVWPRFVPSDRYYGMLLKNGWLEHLADGTPTNGLPYDRAGSDIDTTDPAAGRWFWDVIDQNFVKRGFDAFWLDETEPDLPPNGSYLHVGPGTEYFNVYPLFHTSAVYAGMRRDMRQRAFILARSAYLGAQRNGTVFWSSDVAPTWSVLRRQVPTGINFVASGMPYWSTDIGGWQALPAYHHPQRPVLIDPSDARAVVGHDDDYPELYVRWFEYGAFLPNFRTHGTRPENEVWSYGKQAEPILARFLRLRYQLMPYIYSLGWSAHQTGAPFLRGLFMDFGNDPNVADLGDEYMFGPALLVAPVTEQGMTSREVYLPAGTDWYNFWTHQRLHGGQRLLVSAPIDQIPLFVRAGSILPLGTPVESTNQVQKIAKVLIFPGTNGSFDLYSDDGTTYAYETGAYQISHLQWNDATQKFSHSGADVGFANGEVVQVVK